MTTIENLYFGNINPSEVNVNDDSKIAHLTRIAIKNENRFLNMLTKQQRKQFDKFKESDCEMHSECELEFFIEGFKLGMRLAVEGLTNNKVNTDLTCK